MLDARIYRMSFLIPALALVVLAFSLTDQPGALRASLAPGAFDGGRVASSMQTLKAEYRAGAGTTCAASSLAGDIRSALSSPTNGFTASCDTFTGDTTSGLRTLTNVVATRPGAAANAGSIVVVAPRDGPGEAGLSGTAMMMELGHDLGGETLQRTVVLASINGGQGAAGAMRLAARLPRPIDAVIVLGDVASRHRGQPIILPWTSGEAFAPTRLRNTLSAALAGQSGIHAGAPHLLSQLAHLAFPLTVSTQAAFGTRGVPAVELSLSGERGPRPDAPVLDAARLNAIGRGVLSAISALDAGPRITAPSDDVLFDHELVPSWAIALFVLCMIVPVLLTTIDGLARARRRRYPVGRSVVAVLAAASPFLAAGLVLVIGRAFGALRSPPGAVGPGAIGVDGAAVAVMAVALLVALGCGVLVRAAFSSVAAAEAARVARPSRVGPRFVDGTDAGAGTAAALLLVLCVATVLVWIGDPFAAALLVPALHLWMWAIEPDLALPSPARIAMLVLGVVPTAGLVVFYAQSLHFAPAQLGWEAVLLLAGHIVSWVAAIEWSLVLGCLLTGAVLVVSAARRPEPVPPPVTVRGPIGYAGPGSLGGTKSALRR